MHRLSFAAVVLALVGCASSKPAPVARVATPTHLLSASLNEDDALQIGSVPPDFEAKNQNGRTVQLSALAGRDVVLFFYTQDETPLSTREASDLRDAYEELEKKGVVVIGVSHDSPESHAAFAKNHRLPFALVSDENGELARAYGVPDTYGVSDRQTFVIGRNGRIQNVYRTVDVPRHALQLIADVSR
jgi:peroxiredoxin Q/BCP